VTGLAANARLAALFDDQDDPGRVTTMSRALR
jgi:hypothetical protein